MIVDGVLAPMELAHLPYRKGGTFETMSGYTASSAWVKPSGALMFSPSSICFAPL